MAARLEFGLRHRQDSQILKTIKAFESWQQGGWTEGQDFTRWHARRLTLDIVVQDWPTDAMVYVAIRWKSREAFWRELRTLPRIIPP